jgi:hypothetical protein
MKQKDRETERERARGLGVSDVSRVDIEGDGVEASLRRRAWATANAGLSCGPPFRQAHTFD